MARGSRIPRAGSIAFRKGRPNVVRMDRSRRPRPGAAVRVDRKGQDDVAEVSYRVQSLPGGLQSQPTLTSLLYSCRRTWMNERFKEQQRLYEKEQAWARQQWEAEPPRGKISGLGAQCFRTAGSFSHHATPPPANWQLQGAV